MAEGLLRAELGPEFCVVSAGLEADEGLQPHPEAIRLMAVRNVDLTPFRSRKVTPEMALAADLILVMDEDQKIRCEAMVPSLRGRVFLLGRWLAPNHRNIADPSGGPPEAFTCAFEAIDQSVRFWRYHLNNFRRTQ